MAPPIRHAAALAAVLLFCVAGVVLPAEASQIRSPEVTGNCYKMLILRVIDGDTVYGYIDTSDPVVAIRARLRLAGINAPERGGRAHCVAEKQQGKRARKYVEALLERALETRSRSLARACDIRRGKYATRRLGRLEVRLDNGWVDVGEQLLRRGLAVTSRTGKATGVWCSAPTEHGSEAPETDAG